LKKSPYLLVLAFFTLFAAVVLNPITFVSASSTEGWVRRYGENDRYTVESIIQTSDGGYVIGGGTRAGILLLKTDSYGNMEWNQTYGGGKAYSLIETSDGGYALVSNTQLIKTDAYGNMEWNRILLEEDRASARSLIQASDGGYVIAGSYKVGYYLNVYGAKRGHEDYFWLVKTDELGEVEWSKKYETVITGGAQSVIQTIDGGYALLGFNNFNPDFLLVKTDSSGEVEWSKKYEKPDGDVGQCIVQNSDGGYTLAGRLWNRSDNENMAGLIKTDSNGTMLWMKNYPGSWHVSMVGTSDGGYILCSDLMLTKTDSEGNMQWTKHLNFSMHLVIQTLDGGYAITGGGSSVWIIKTDPEGIIPEFPSWTPLMIALVAVVAVAIAYRDRLKKQRLGGFDAR